MAAVAVSAALIVVASRSEVSVLSDQRRRDGLSATAAAADAYVRAGGWDGAHLISVATVAAGGRPRWPYWTRMVS